MSDGRRLQALEDANAKQEASGRDDAQQRDPEGHRQPKVVTPAAQADRRLSRLMDRDRCRPVSSRYARMAIVGDRPGRTPLHSHSIILIHGNALISPRKFLRARRRTVSPIPQKFALLNSKEKFADSESARFHPLSVSIDRFLSFRENDRIAPKKKTVSAGGASSRVLERIHLRLHCPLKCRPRFTALLVGT